MTTHKALNTHDPDAWKRSDPTWPNQTELEKRLRGKTYHHDPHCNARRGGPMGCDGCSCFYREGRRITTLKRW